MSIPQDVRNGEQLDTEALAKYLRQQSSNGLGFGALSEVRQFRGGYSNLTYLLTTGSGKFVLRRPPLGPRSGNAHNMKREHGLLAALHDFFGSTDNGGFSPKPLLYVGEDAGLDSEFYLMEYVEGDIIRTNAGGDAAVYSPAQLQAAAAEAMTVLAKLHSADCSSDPFADLGRPQGYVERQVEGWVKRFNRAKSDDIISAEPLIEYLRAGQPSDSDGSFVHNDFKFDNVIFKKGSDYSQVAAVLDWEMATIGNPLLDLGQTLAYWAHEDEVREMPFLGVNATHLPGCPRRPELVATYSEFWRKLNPDAAEVPDMTWYYVYGNFKIAGIIQQIYARYLGGYTKDPRFAKMGLVVNYLLARGMRATESGRID